MTNQPVPQCCGVCRWWGNPYFNTRPLRVGACDSKESTWYMRIRLIDDGKYCPCFERKEGE